MICHPVCDCPRTPASKLLSFQASRGNGRSRPSGSAKCSVVKATGFSADLPAVCAAAGVPANAAADTAPIDASKLRRFSTRALSVNCVLATGAAVDNVRGFSNSFASFCNSRPPSRGYNFKTARNRLWIATAPHTLTIRDSITM